MRRQTIMRLLVLSIVGLFAVLLVSAPAASARCGGPSMTFVPHDVVRGGKVTATGERWGDNCYDTGPPPAGEGVLGRPIDDIEIVVVQGDREWVVATVDADADYGFVTHAIVPEDVAPGDAQLVARRAGTLPYASNSDPSLRISAASAGTSQPTTETRSSPSTQQPANQTSDNELDSQGSGTDALWFVVVAGAVVAALAAGAWVVAARRKSS